MPPHLRYEALVNVSRDARGFDWLEIRDVNISKQRHSVAACDDQDQVTSGLLLCLSVMACRLVTRLRLVREMMGQVLGQQQQCKLENTA